MYKSFNLNKSLENQLGKSQTLDPRTIKLFDNALKASTLSFVGRYFGKASKPMLVLQHVLVTDGIGGNRHYDGAHTIAVADIHGTIDRAGDFDYDFAPMTRTTEHRWCKVATAMLRGIELPPIELVQVNDHYFVKDGHHRVSVARALGFAYLDAIVEIWGG